eukprot:TRINITY_DN20953_c0_g1_i1.p1 TRINITY_DN20953_c0_g1~~TRINITY_DN20953_c0_g1_i1.p1  ORF type:complete len:300 (+),score=97.40 TRINITY_DN20953_c0_g1_i1:103-1002(+)
MGRRQASHAGSWYPSSKAELGRMVSDMFRGSSTSKLPNVKAVISPHAGLAYSGSTAAHAFQCTAGSMDGVERVFVLGPSHHQYFTDVRLCSFDVFESPIYNLNVCQRTNAELVTRGKEMGLGVGWMDEDGDVDEHSVELQMPFVSEVVKGTGAAVVPIVVGSLNERSIEAYGKLLAPYIDDPASRFVISSDFCHWGSRFRYTYHYKQNLYPKIGDAIEAMDREAMRLIEQRDLPGLRAYFTETENTICGRTPIQILLESLRHSAQGGNAQIQFVHYSQSSRAQTARCSSVSYASAVVTM